MGIQSEIVRILPEDGGRRRYHETWGIVARQVGREIPQQEFEGAVAALVAAGRIRRTTSGGGLDHLSLVSAPARLEDAGRSREATKKSHPAESQLMGALQTWLDARFRFSLGARVDAIVQNTAQGGPRSGVWSRPDFTVAAVRRFNYSTLREVELYGFELKRAASGSVIGVHEALAHTRWVHYSYFVWHTPEPGSVIGDFDAIRGECARHGIGLVTFVEPENLETWTITLEAEKTSPDPLLVDDYIDERFAPDQRQKLKTWLGEP